MELLQQIAQQENLVIQRATPLSGGDINDVFQVQTSAETLVVKVNEAQRFPNIFLKEAAGLKALQKTKAFLIPTVIAVGEIAAYTYLILDYLSPAPVRSWDRFGEQLAQLHQYTAPQFGFSDWNYIGRLRQDNDYRDTAVAFLIEQRLEPQFRLAQQQGFNFQNIDQLYRRIEQLIPNEAPALLHGDLWSGNYLSTTNGFALIDPAACFGSREMDLAMMQLFGGFPSIVFHRYEELFPTDEGLEERIPLYQLYYLLVHVNMFGVSYYRSCTNIMQRYS